MCLVTIIYHRDKLVGVVYNFSIWLSKLFFLTELKQLELHIFLEIVGTEILILEVDISH